MKPFEIFRTGTHVSSEGVKLTFTDAELASIAADYNTALHHAPIVIGHPKQDKPAYCWVNSLAARGDRLIATPAEIDASFSDIVRDGRYRKVSAAFYQPNSPNNPTPGAYYLRHVGFLGAAAPAVKGLRQVEFADGDLVVTFDDIDFSDHRLIWGVDTTARLFRRFREWLIESQNIETADRVVPEWEVNQLNETATELRAEKAESKAVAYSESNTKEPDMNDQAAAELATREAEVTRRENALREAEQKRRATADAAFVDSMVKAGKLPLGLQATATALFADLGEGELTFADGDGEESKTTPRAAFRALLDGLPLPVKTGEVATGDGPDFSDPAYVTSAIETEIRTAKDRGENISPAQAAMRLTSGR